MRAAADELGYVGPDPRAASLRHGRSGIVAVVLEGRLGYAFTDPTGIVAQSDQLAAGGPLAARDLRIEVPGELSVIGFDGVDLPWLGATLTTIDQDGFAKGAALGAMVSQALAGSPAASREHPVTLRLGTTTAPPPS